MTEFEVVENTASFGLNTRHTARGERHGGAIIVNNGRPIMGHIVISEGFYLEGASWQSISRQVFLEQQYH